MPTAEVERRIWHHWPAEASRCVSGRDGDVVVIVVIVVIVAIVVETAVARMDGYMICKY